MNNYYRDLYAVKRYRVKKVKKHDKLQWLLLLIVMVSLLTLIGVHTGGNL